MLAAQIVGPSGEVVGIERDPRTITRARARILESGLANVTFTQSDVNDITTAKPFDAVVGRYILMCLLDPTGVLRALTQLVRPGGSSSFPRRFLGTCDRPCSRFAPLVGVHFSNCGTLPSFWCEPGNGTCSPPSFSRGGTTSFQDAHGSPPRR